jgi:hypothetical protein
MTLTEEERAQLLNWLEQSLRNKLVEEHRTYKFATFDAMLRARRLRMPPPPFAEAIQPPRRLNHERSVP